MSTAAVLESPSSIRDDEWIFSEDELRSKVAAAKSWVKLLDEHYASAQPILFALRLQMSAELSDNDPDLLEGYSGSVSDDAGDGEVLRLMSLDADVED